MVLRYYNDAVKASFLLVTGAANPGFEAIVGSETEGSITLAKIMTQKHIALFGNAEAWVDYRRTNLPALTPNPAGDVDGIPNRLPTVLDERLYNSNVIIESDILEPVWWAK